MLSYKSEEIERAGRLLYESDLVAGPVDGPKPRWIPYGNSTKQDECRRMALRIVDVAFPTEPQAVMERLALEAALERMGWPEINAFNEELARGQDVHEDGGGYFMRAIRRLFGLGTTKPTVETYRSAANRMIEKAGM